MGFQEFMDTKIAPAVNKFAQQRHTQAIRDGAIINIIPMVGSLFLLLATLPIPGYGDFIRSIGLFDALLIPIGATFDLMGMTVAISIAYRLAESYKMDALAVAIISLLCFFMLTPYRISHELVEGGISGVMPIMYLGSRGLFTALFVSLCSTEVYVRLCRTKLVITMPDGVPPAVAKSFAALIPGGLTLIVFWLLRLLIDVSSFENIHTILAEFVTMPLSRVGNTIWGAIIYIFLVHFFWFFGIHGQLVVAPIFSPIFTVLQDANRLAFQNGEEIPNIITGHWFDLYVFLGGSGATLSIVIALMFFVRSKHLKGVGKLSFAPGIFNINEPFVFGVPVVFNPILFIPWVFVPIMNVCTAYFATIIGFLPRHNGIVTPWTTPVIISGLIIVGWRGVVMQIINLTLSAIIWFVFIKKLDTMEYEKELEALKNDPPNINN